jgi:hypothetical protein
MSHTARSTPFFGTGSSYHEHRRQRLKSMSPRIERSVLHANIGNEWNTPDSHTWRSQSDLKKQVKYGGLQERRTMLHSSLGALQLSPVLAVLIKEDEGITLRTALARACQPHTDAHRQAVQRAELTVTFSERSAGPRPSLPPASVPKNVTQ